MEPEELRKQLRKGAIVGSFFALALLFYALGWRRLLVAYVVITGVLAVLAILLQSGRGGGLAASLGGLGADSLLGTHSATPIAKATYVMLGLFVFITMLVARMGLSRPAEGGLIPPPQPAKEAPLRDFGVEPPGEPPAEAPTAPEAPALPQEGSTPEPGESAQND